MGENRKNLSYTLTEGQKEILEKYDDVINELHSIKEIEAFSYGFRLGVRMIIESENMILKEHM